MAEIVGGSETQGKMHTRLEGVVAFTFFVREMPERKDYPLRLVYALHAVTSVILHFVSWEWDHDKAAGNLEKHGVSFEEAVTVFEDPLYVDFYDPDHSAEEHRYLIVGMSLNGRLLIVSYTERSEAVRLISAREVTPAERKAYEE